MKAKKLLTLLVALGMFGTSQARAVGHGPSRGKLLQHATIDSTRSFDFVSTTNREAYRVKVFIPKGIPPKGGFPVLYVLDGNLLFGTFAEAVHNQSQASEIEPAVVVGIEDGPGVHGADRTFDFTATDLTAEEKRIIVDLGPNPRYGGYDLFFQTLEQEIKPRVAHLTTVNPNRASIFGWSLAGLFVVHTLLSHPDAFQAYATLSPSLWRTNRAVFAEIPRFEEMVVARDLNPKLFVGVGSLEEQLSPGMRAWTVNQTKLAEEMKYGHMVENARDFAGKLRPFFQQRELPFEFRVFEGDTHNTAPWSATNPVLRFLLAPRETDGQD